ncbi:hypothetical protein ZHAS_00002710 [Anopheles sinensis]|uniref:Uncharacterized protein n=1 Tax=Anopheles sinensis TaxID=74873 RepID=A0A084VCU8_ANOSI|nr:hypothetical protein ZHAS_00002710 [Anopheles sinensis]
METLAETSLPPGLRRPEPSQLIPTSPEGEQSPQNSNPGSVLANIIGASPGSGHHLLEDHSQSSQDDSGSMVSPAGNAEPEETIENIVKELSESCVDTDSQPTELPIAGSSPTSGKGSRAQATATSTSAGGKDGGGSGSTGAGLEMGGKPRMGAVANGDGGLPKVANRPGGKPMAMREFDRKMNKARGRPKRKAIVAMYQSEVRMGVDKHYKSNRIVE